MRKSRAGGGKLNWNNLKKQERRISDIGLPIYDTMLLVHGKPSVVVVHSQSAKACKEKQFESHTMNP